MSRKKKTPRDRSPPWNAPPEGPDTLSPGEVDQECLASLDVIEFLMHRSRSEPFRTKCEEFLKAAQPGDQIVEFCARKSAWDRGMGSAGFLLKRDDIVIDLLLTAMN